MSRFLSLALVTVSWLAGLCAAWAQERPVLTWLIADLPPVSMPVKGQPTVGATDVLLLRLAERWPEVQHQYVVSNASRSWAELAEGREVCVSGAVITPERERIAYFAPTHFGIPLQLITRSDQIERLPRNGQGEVLPASLFDSAALRGLVVRERSYGSVLDALLNRRAANSGISYAVLADGGNNIFKMLALGRADYTVEYDFALAYQQQRDPEFFRQHPLVALPIAGTAAFVSGIACPRTPWGRRMIVQIDSRVAQLAAQHAYQQAADRWLTADTLRRYRAARSAFFKQRAHPTPPQNFP